MKIDFIKEELDKIKKINEILFLIQSNKDVFKEFSLEVKVFKKGVELKSS